MREIKFRAWDGKRIIYHDWRNSGSQVHDLWQFVVTIDTHCILMQYIGLKDKNGKEIYEGDIIKGNVNKNANEVCAGVIAADLLGKEAVGFINYSSLYAQFYFTIDEIIYLDLCFGIRDYEIIGNIYENPELIKTQ